MLKKEIENQLRSLENYSYEAKRKYPARRQAIQDFTAEIHNETLRMVIRKDLPGAWKWLMDSYEQMKNWYPLFNGEGKKLKGKGKKLTF